MNYILQTTPATFPPPPLYVMVACTTIRLMDQSLSTDRHITRFWLIKADLLINPDPLPAHIWQVTFAHHVFMITLLISIFKISWLSKFGVLFSKYKLSFVEYAWG